MNEQNTIKLKKQKEPLHCICCNYITRIKCDYNKHLLTRKHDKNSKRTITEDIPIKKEECVKEASAEEIDYRKIILYTCCNCDFKTNDKKDYNRHINTQKHKERNSQCSETNTNENENSEITNIDSSNEKITIDKNILLELIKQSNDFKQLMIDQNAKLLELAEKRNTTINNNCNNNRFNLNFFLNEQCKDAMNINDFIDSIEIGFDELEYVGKHGYINGITKIVSDSLKQIGLYKRPIHCTDLKREIIHIKDQDEWKKEDDNHEITNKMIDTLSTKNLRLVGSWQKEHPEYAILDSPEYYIWWNIAKQANAHFDKNTAQILKNITKIVHVDKIDGKEPDNK